MLRGCFTLCAALGYWVSGAKMGNRVLGILMFTFSCVAPESIVWKWICLGVGLRDDCRSEIAIRTLCDEVCVCVCVCRYILGFVSSYVLHLDLRALPNGNKDILDVNE